MPMLRERCIWVAGILVLATLLTSCAPTATAPPPLNPPSTAPQAQGPEPVQPPQSVPTQVTSAGLPADALPTNAPDCDPSGTPPARIYVQADGYPGGIAGLCTAFMDVGPLIVDVVLPAGTTEAMARQSLTILAPQQPTFRFEPNGKGLILFLSFPAGAVGDRLLVRLHGLLGGKQEDMAVLLQRSDQIRIRAGVGAGAGE